MRLFFKILLILFITIIISFIIYASTIIEKEKQRTEKNLTEKIEYNEKVYLSSVSALLFEFNKETLDIIIKSIYTDKEIVKIELKDKSDIVNITLDKKYIKTPDILKSEIQLIYNEQSLGTLNIFYTKKFVNEHIDEYRNSILLFSILLILILLITLYIFIKKFTESLALLTNAADKISSGDLSQKIIIQSNDEIGQLSNKFEIMRTSLKDRIEVNEKQSQKLDLLNKNLEKKVENRTVELKRANEELEDSNEELQTMVYNLKTTQDKLIESEKMASLGSLVAGVAHEINTPIGIGLTGITHFIEESSKLNNAYKNEEMTEEKFNKFLENTDELSQLIKKNLERTAQLVKSFKQVAVDQTSDIKREVNLKEYISEVLFSLNNITKKTNIDISIVSNEDIVIETYPGSISQIITNLIINSIRHGFKEKEKGIINIEITYENEKIRLIYTDSGRGIKKENLNKIFDPFFTTNREEGGTGLGLNIIYNIITTTLQGTIECNSEENKGVEFIISFKA